jgi:ferredoxin-NADP reductase
MNLSPEHLILVVSKITQLTPRIRAYEFRLNNNAELPLAMAGSHLAIPVQLPNGKTDVRHYSICSNPNQRNIYEIAVLLEENGRGGSQFIIDNFALGTQLTCAKPTNHFQLHADASPSVLIAGGIGITPIIAIAHTLALRGRRFQLHYAGRSKNEMAFVDELETHFKRYVQVYSAAEHQRLDIMHVLADAPNNTLFYACGPQKMLDEIETCARIVGIASDQIQQENFSPEKQANDQALVIELAYSNKLIQVAADQPLLGALRDAGVNVPFDCCIGDCGTCAVKILEGEADHRDHVLDDAKKAQGYMCTCVSRAKSDKLVLAL